MTEKSSLEDDLFQPAPEVDEPSHAEEAFLKDVLGPHADEVPEPKEVRREEVAKHAAPPEYWETSGGKRIEVRQKESGKYHVVFTSGGELPAELQGEFTDETLAAQQIRIYLARS